MKEFLVLAKHSGKKVSLGEYAEGRNLVSVFLEIVFVFVSVVAIFCLALEL